MTDLTPSRHFLLVVLSIMMLLGASTASFAGSNNGLVYHGRILSPDGTSLNSGATTFTVEIRGTSNYKYDGSLGTPAAVPGTDICVLYRETHSKDMTNSLGLFEIFIGEGTSPVWGVNAVAADKKLSNLFVNNSTDQKNYIRAISCINGSAAPNGDLFYFPYGIPDANWVDRQVVVTVNTGSDTFTLKPMSLRSTPWALQAAQIGGYGPSNLMRMSGAGSTNVFSPTAANFLFDFSSLGMLVTAGALNTNGVSVTGLPTPVAASDATNKSYVDAQIASVTAGGLSANSVTSAHIIDGAIVNADVNAAAAIARTKLASGTANHVVINSGTGAMSSEAQLAISRGGTGTGTVPTDGQLLIGGGSAYTPATLTAGSGILITNAAGSVTIARDPASASGTVTSVGLTLPAEITVSNSPVTATGSLTGAWANQTTNKIFAAPNGSTGTPTFRSLLSADLPVVDVAHGGTGQSSTFTANALMMANGTGAAMTTGLTCALNEIPKWNGTTWACAAVGSGSQWTTTGSDIYYNTGKVGVGTAAPAAKLEVAGDVKVGNSSATCDGTTKGSIRYNNATSVLEFCNGTSWNLIQAAACSDATPNNFVFTDQSNVVISTLTTSDIVQIAGINCRVPVSVSGLGTPAYRICSDAACATVLQDWTTGSASIGTGEYLQVRQTSDAAGGAIDQITVIVGTAASVWSVATAGGDCTGTPAIGTICADGSIYAGMSPDGGGVKMYTQRCDLGQTWNGSACTGTRLTITWNNATGNWISTGKTNGITGKSNSAGLSASADIGSPYYAAQNCENLNENGQTDWYLPALSELNILYQNKATIRNFVTSGSSYWSSSEFDARLAWYERFSDGVQGFHDSIPKSSGLLVRCVRR